MKDIDGNEVSFEKYRDKVCLVVNVASQWGMTKANYIQLEQLYEKYSSQGLSIMAFPCNQFASQEPGTNEEIKHFAQDKYNAKYDLYSKINVNGDGAAPLFKWLKSRKNGKGTLTNSIKWNFSKFLVDRQGEVAARFAPNVEPMSKDITGKIEKLLWTKLLSKIDNKTSKIWKIF